MGGFYVKLWYRTDKRDIGIIAKFSSYEVFVKESEHSFDYSIEAIFKYACKFYSDIEFSDSVEVDLIEYEEGEVSEFLDLTEIIKNV
jgi:hypothetical protein